MRRMQFVFALAIALVALAVILDARQLWVASSSSTSTSGTVSITSNDSAALAVTGGIDVGGVIQAGSGNVNITNSTGNLLESAIADGSVYPRLSGDETITGSWTFQNTLPIAVVPVTGAVGLRVQGRSSDDLGAIAFTNNAATGTHGQIRGDSGTLRFYAGLTPTNVFDLQESAIVPRVRINTTTTQPGFLAYNSADDSGQGNGATVDVDTEVFDNTSSFSADTFTAPVTGQYQFCGAALIGTAAARVTLNLATTSATYGLAKDQHASEATLLSGCVYAPMTATNTAHLTISLADGTAVIYATNGTDGASTRVTYFSGRLVP